MKTEGEEKRILAPLGKNQRGRKNPETWSSVEKNPLGKGNLAHVDLPASILNRPGCNTDGEFVRMGGSPRRESRGRVLRRG